MSDSQTCGCWPSKGQVCWAHQQTIVLQPETPMDPPAAPTGTDAGVAELVEHLRTQAAYCREIDGSGQLYQRAADALAQQATQLKEARQALDATEEEMELFKAHAFRLADELEAAESQLTSLRAKLETAKQALLAIAGLINSYLDGTTLSAAETLRAVAAALVPALSPPVAPKER